MPQNHAETGIIEGCEQFLRDLEFVRHEILNDEEAKGAAFRTLYATDRHAWGTRVDLYVDIYGLDSKAINARLDEDMVLSLVNMRRQMITLVPELNKLFGVNRETEQLLGHLAASDSETAFPLTEVLGTID